MEYPDDTEFDDRTITKVEHGDKGWYITSDAGWSFYIPDLGVTPKVGCRARFYGAGIGSIVRGVYIDGRKVFYRTEAEQKIKNVTEQEAQDRERREEADKNRPEIQAKIRALPQPFQDRINGFLSHNPDFEWTHLPYELFVCEQAVLIAGLGSVAEIEKFNKAGWEAQKRQVPALSSDHSGNTFGSACVLAARYLDSREDLPKIHGALCPLVGCKDYGCYAAR